MATVSSTHQINAQLNLQHLLEQQEEYSSLSAQESFDLEDILQEPIDEEVIQDAIDFNEEDFDDLFQDQNPSQESQSKVFQFKQTPSQIKLNQSQHLQKSVKNQTFEHDSQKTLTTVKNRAKRLSDQPIIPEEEIINMTYVKLKNVTKLFSDDQSNTSVGIPTSITATGNKYLALGTSMGNIVLFEVGTQGYKLLGTQEQRKFGYVNSIAISRDNKYLVAGHETGLVALWDLYSLKIIKQELLNRAKIIKVAFCSQTYQNFITSDLQGNIYMFTIQKYIWSNLKSQKLIQKSQMVYFDIRYHQLQSQRHIIALTNLDSVFLVSVKPQVKVMGKIQRPQNISQFFFPLIQMGHCQILNIQANNDDIKPFYDVLIVAWANMVYLYRFVPSNHSLQSLELIYTFNHDQNIHNIQYLNDNIFVTLDDHQNFRTIRFDVTNVSNLTSNSKDKKYLPNVSHLVINSKQMEEEVIYQRFMKDKQNKYIKSFTNTLINCSFNPQQKEIFFICKNSVYRGRLNKWSQFVYDLINQQKNFRQALKICLELVKGELNIFSQRIQLVGKSGQRSLKIFCQIGKIFLQEQLKVIKKLNHDRSPNFQHQDVGLISKELEQAYDIVIEYFIDLKCQKYLFSNIYQRIVKALPNFQYWEVFLQALRSFINEGKLKCIPNAKVFQQILDYYSSTKNKNKLSEYGQNDNLKLLDTMILNLTKQSIFYEQTVLLLTQNKLYKSLAYICSTNSDYISSCNKILAQIRECHQSKRFNAQQEYYQILKEYLTKILQGKYLNDLRIQSKRYQIIIRDLTIWVSYEENMSYFLKHPASHVNNSEKYKEKAWEKVYDLLNFITEIYCNLFQLGQSSQFHEFTTHLIQALDKLSPSKKQSVEKLQFLQMIKWFKNQIALNIIKYCIKFQNPQRKTKKVISLKKQQIQYIIQHLYKNNDHQTIRQSSIQLTLQQKFTFLFFYFDQISDVTYDEIHIENKSQHFHYPFQEIYERQGQHVKFLYNYLVTNMLRSKDKQNRNLPVASQDFQQQQQAVLHAKSEKPVEQNQINLSEQVKKKLKLLKFDYKKIQQSSLKQMSPQNLKNNITLTNFILQNGTYDQIDDSIESLIKINSQLLIVYILQNYSIDLVNVKIDLIGNQQIKYEVVRRILKIIRKQKQQKKIQDLTQNKEKRKVWGNQFKNYRKKKQAIQQIQSKKYLHYQKKLSKQNILFYLTELCKYKKQRRVYVQLKHNISDYKPYFTDIIGIMKQFNLNSCLGLIYFELNELDLAFEFYQKIYNERFQQNIHKLTLVQYCHGRFLRKIYNEMLQICHLKNSNSLWQKLLQTVLAPMVHENKFSRKRKQLIIDLIQKVFQAIKLDNRFIKELAYVIETTLLEVSNNITMPQMSIIVQKFSVLLNKTFILNCLRSTLSTYSKNIYIYLLSNQMIKIDQVKEFQKIFYDYKLKGIGYSLYCERCRQKIDIDDHMRIYKCSHVYHNYCISGQDRCQQCLMLQVGQNLRLNSVQSSSFIDNGCLQLKKKESSSSKSIKKEQMLEESQQQKKQNIIYQCLAFEDYLTREQEKLQQFKKDYQGHLSRYG